MIELDDIDKLNMVRRNTDIMCYACGRTCDNPVYMYPPGAAVATHIYFPSCGHMEKREVAGMWRTHELHASAQAYLTLLDLGE